MALPTFSAGERLTAAKLTQICSEITASTLIATKASLQTVNNSATLVDDSDLFVALAASTTYVFELTLLFASNGTADIKYGFTFPALATCEWGSIRLVSSSAGITGDADFGSYNSATSGSSTVAAAGTSSAQLAVVNGTITTAGTSGNLRLQWAQNTANVSDTTVYAGSSLVVHRD